MPLIKSKSSKAVGENISREMSAGKPHKQSIAIALSVQRSAKKKKAKGGEISATKEDMTNVDKARDDRDLKMMAQGGLLDAKSEKRPSADDDDMERGHEKHAEDRDLRVQKRADADDSTDEREMVMSHGAKMSHDADSDMRKEHMPAIDDALDTLELAMRREQSKHSPYKEMDAKKESMQTESMMAKGGSVMNPKLHEAMKGKSIADSIMMKKKYADGGQVDLAENAEEEPNNEDDLSFDALRKENYSESPGLKDLDYDTSRSVGDKLQDADEANLSMIDKIRKNMKSKGKL